MLFREILPPKSKYTVLALELLVEPEFTVLLSNEKDFMITHEPFLPSQDPWEKWLGTLKMAKLKDVSLSIVAWGPTEDPKIFDGNASQKEIVFSLYSLLRLTVPYFSCEEAHPPICEINRIVA